MNHFKKSFRGYRVKEVEERIAVLETQLAQSKSVLEQKQALIHEKQISNEQLQDLLENGSEQELIERAAREKLDYVYANEEVYEDLSGK